MPNVFLKQLQLLQKSQSFKESRTEAVLEEVEPYQTTLSLGSTPVSLTNRGRLWSPSFSLPRSPPSLSRSLSLHRSPACGGANSGRWRAGQGRRAAKARDVRGRGEARRRAMGARAELSYADDGGQDVVLDARGKEGARKVEEEGTTVRHGCCPASTGRLGRASRQRPAPQARRGGGVRPCDGPALRHLSLSHPTRTKSDTRQRTR